MIQVLIFLAAAGFGIALFLNIGRAWAFLRALSKSERAGLRVWVVMFLALALFFQRDELVTDVTTVDASAIYQLVCVAIAWLFLVPLVGTARNLDNVDLVSGSMLAYGLTGVVSCIFSPAPFLSLYKAGLFLTDAVILVCVMTAFRNRPNTTAPLDVTYILVSLFAWGSLLGAIIRPDIALRELGGALGIILEGTLPYMNPNELGFLGAITFLVGIRRVFEREPFGLRFFYAAQAFLGFVVVFLAQSRTSLVAVSLGLIVFAVSIRKMRLLVATVVCVAMFGLIIFSSAEDRQSVAESVQDNAMSYAERGHDVFRTLEGRMEGWKIGLRMFGDAPILGHGYDAGVRYKGGQYGFGNLSHMHNSHFQVLVNSGIVGYAIWLIMFIVPLFLVFRSFGGAFFGRTVVERYSVELFVIMLLIFLRSITGQILVTHQWSLMIFMGAYLHLKLGRVATPLIPVRPGKAGRPAARWPRRTSSVNQVRYSRHEP